MRGVVDYSPHPTVAILDSQRPGESHKGIPVVGSVADALPYEPTTALVGVATQGGRFPPAWRDLLKDSIAAGLDVESGLHEFISEDPELVRAGGAPRRRAPRPAQAAAGPQRPDRREPQARGEDRAHRRLRLRDRQEDGRDRARPRGARARPRSPSSSRPARRASRSRAGASRSTRSSPTSSPAPPSGSSSKAPRVGERCSSSRARARSRIRPTRVSRSGSCTDRRRTRTCSATWPVRRRSRATRAIRCLRSGRSSSCTSAYRFRLRPARVAAIALNTRDLGEDEARAAARDVEEETGLPTDDPVRFGSQKVLDAVLTVLQS